MLKSPDQKDFENTVRGIRSSNNYIGSLDNVRHKLELPDSTKRFEIEALLIHATREQFEESLDADMVLMALGLLKGFPSPRNSSENRSGSELITVRRRMFIWTSSYVPDKHSASNKHRKVFYESCEELKVAGEDAVKAVIKALNTEDGNAIDKVAQKLYSKRRKINEYLDEAKKYLIYSENGKVIDVELQDLKHIRQKNQNTTSTGPDESEIIENDIREDDCLETLDFEINDGDTIQQPDNSGITENSIQEDNYTENPCSDPLNPPKPKEKAPLSIIIFGIATIVLSLALFVVHTIKNYQIETIKLEPPKTIKFTNSEIYLPLGKIHNLTIDVIPPDSELHNLKCESLNPDTVEILSESNLRIKATDSFKSNTSHDATIKVYLPDNEYITDKMIVHVFDQNTNGSISEGRNNNLSSGDFIKK